MFCYTCKKFIKKGHGKNLWVHPNPWGKRRVGVRGENKNRYYCNFCLKVKDYWKRMNNERWHYTISDVSYNLISGYVVIAFLLLLCLFWYLSLSKIVFIISSVVFLMVFCICLVIDFQNKSKTKKENAEIAKRRDELWGQYEKLKRERWKPLAREKELLRKAETYLKSKYPNEEFCHCEKCLLAEWEKNN